MDNTEIKNYVNTANLTQLKDLEKYFKKGLEMIKCRRAQLSHKDLKIKAIKATVIQMRKILKEKGIDFNSRAKKAELSILIRQNRLVREVERMKS